MKKTLFAVAALALCGTAFADEVVYTHLEGAERHGWTTYCGEYYEAPDDQPWIPKDVSGGNVVVTEGTDVDPDDILYVYGGYTGNGYADNNSVKMQGGAVAHLYGGQGTKGAKGNTVAVTGGTISQSVYGGRGDNASGNTVIISGGSVGIYVIGGYGEDATNNAVHLVGAGATATINGEQYTGQEGGITIGRKVMVGCATGGKSENNSVNLYGNSITADALTDYDHLNFHMVDSTDTILTLSSEYYVLNLGDVALTFDFSEPVAPASAITLIQSAGGITLSGEQLATEYIIKGSDGLAVATGTLELSEDNKTLKMNFGAAPATPEPATATLSLLALAGMAARRRRK